MAVDPRLDKPPARRRLIVVVDDDEGIREVCVDALGEAGYDVDAFARGEDALRALTTVAPAVLVVDWNMPGLDGIEVTRRARAHDPRLPVLMVTGDIRAATIAARGAGVDRLLDKPFRVEDLVDAVRALAGETEGVTS